MFMNLQEAIRRRGMTNSQLAQLLGIHRNTLENKLSGENRFNLDEIKLIKATFPEYTFEYLFSTDEPPKSA